MRALFLSAHLDDVVLSCSGKVVALKETGAEVDVLTIFAGVPEGVVSPLIGDGAMVKLRRYEDAQACASLSASVSHADVIEAAYRQDDAGAFLYPSWPSISRARHSKDHAVDSQVEQVVSDALARHPYDVVFGPVGLGHVDHLILSDCLRTRDWGVPVVHYADCPAMFDYRVGPEFAPLETLHLDTADALKKARAVLLYSSQIELVFGVALNEADLAGHCRQVPELFFERARKKSHP